MARGRDMQEVELLDGDEDVTEQPVPPARSRRRLWWIPAGAVAVALSLIGTQLVLDARENAAVARLAALPGVFPPIGDELVVVRAIPPTDAYNFWGALELGGTRTAGLMVAPDGSQSLDAVDLRTGEAFWSTPLVGPNADRAVSRADSYGGTCQGDGAWGEPATVAVCLATDGFVRYEDGGTEERFPATSSRVVVLDLDDGHVITEWVVEGDPQLVLVGDLAVVGSRDAERGVVVVAHDVLTGDEEWRYEKPVGAGAHGPPDQYWGLITAGDAVGLDDGDGLVLLSSTGSLIRDDLRAATRGGYFATDPVTGTLELTSYAGTGKRTTTLLARDADPAGDVVLRGEPVEMTVDDGSLPGVVLTSLSHAYAWDRETGEQLWEADVQPNYNALVVRGRVYLTTSTEIVALDGRSGEVVWRTQLPASGAGALATDGRDLLLLSTGYDSGEEGGMTGYDLATGHETRTVRYPAGVSDVQMLHGLLVGWSYTTEELTFLE